MFRDVLNRNRLGSILLPAQVLAHSDLVSPRLQDGLLVRHKLWREFELSPLRSPEFYREKSNGSNRLNLFRLIVER
jgi:hypothetical protein